MFNSGAEAHLNEHGINVIRTDVGDRHIAAAIRKHKLQLGGETSGHIILPHIYHLGDGLICALTVLQMMVETGKSLDDALIPIHPSITRNIPATPELKARATCPIFLQTLSKTYQDNRIVLRPSGTEPVIRITVEGADESHIHTTLDNITRKLLP